MKQEIDAHRLSHRIKNIFSVFNNIISLLACSYTELQPRAKELCQRILVVGKAYDFVRPY